jgi:AraC family transcriptional regulator
MISTALPDIESYSNEQPELKNNAIIFSSTNEKYFYPEHRTPYLFLTNLVNKGYYTLNASNIEISQRKFYFLNANDKLEINFYKSEPMQTLFILFSEKFIRDCFSYSLTSDEMFLDYPEKRSCPEIYFPNVPFELTINIQAIITSLIGGLSGQEESDALLFELLNDFFTLNYSVQKRVRNINAVKQTTKEELYRRLTVAEEMMHDLLFENLTVESISREVCMNKFHFLSTFKEFYKVTPYQYYKELKFQKAFDLLAQNGHSVSEVCYLLGFESVASFSNSFKKRFKITPSFLLTKRKSQF